MHSLNPPRAIVVHYDFGPNARYDHTPLRGFANRRDGCSRGWQRINCADCTAAKGTGTP